MRQRSMIGSRQGGARAFLFFSYLVQHQSLDRACLPAQALLALRDQEAARARGHTGGTKRLKGPHWVVWFPIAPSAWTI